MSKAIKITVILAGIASVTLLLRGCYMVLCISCTSPPIKEYKFQGSVDGLSKVIQTYAASNPDINYKFSRRDSTAKQDNGDRDLQIRLKAGSKTIEYGLVCDQNKTTTTVKLISAFEGNINGGYSVGSPAVKNLLNYFDVTFVNRLKNGDQQALASE